MLRFDVARVRDKPNDFVEWEEYRDAAALDVHVATEHFSRLVERCGRLLGWAGTHRQSVGLRELSGSNRHNDVAAGGVLEAFDARAERVDQDVMAFNNHSFQTTRSGRVAAM